MRSRITALLVVAAFLSGCASAQTDGASGTSGVKLSLSSPAATHGLEQVNWAVSTEPASMDPIYTYDGYDQEIEDNLCETLYQLNPNFTQTPLLATSAQRVNPTTWVYDIRPGVKFWDGHTMTAADVVWSWQRNLDLSLGSYFSDYSAEVKSIKQTGPYQVTVVLKEPDALWNETLVTSGFAVMEKAWGIKEGNKIGTPQGGLMCTGPYKWGGWVRGSHITLLQNATYWNTGARAHVQKIVFSFLADPAAQADALVSGNVDGMYGIDPSAIPTLQHRAAGHLYFGPTFDTYYLGVTTARSPLANVAIRQALALVIDRPGIAKTLYNGAAEPMRTMMTPTGWGSDPAVRSVYNANWNRLAQYGNPQVAAAKKLVAQAGSPKQPIVLAFPTGGVEQELAEAVQSEARQIGLNIALKGYTTAALTNLELSHKAQRSAGVDLIYLPFSLDTADPLDMYYLFIPSIQSVYNLSDYSDPQVTRDLTSAFASYDPVARAKFTAAAESIIMQHMPYIPLVAPYVVSYMNKRVTGAPTSWSIYWGAWANRLGAP